MYKEIRKINSTLDEYTLIPSSATERDQMLRWLPWPPLPGHRMVYEWDPKLERVKVRQEPIPGEGEPAAVAKGKPAAAGATATLPPEQQPGTYVPELRRLSRAELETRAAEMEVPDLAKLKKNPGQLVMAVAKQMAEAARKAAAVAAGGQRQQPSPAE